MDMKALTGLGKVAGIGGIALGVVAILLKDVLSNRVFQGLPPERAYQLLFVITIGLFVLGALGILAWVLAKRAASSGAAKVHAEGGSVAFGDKAKGNVVTINNSPATRKKNAGR
jgi:hypothetical protein